MKFNATVLNLSNDLRERVQRKTETIDDGESVAMALLWGFICDHAECHGMEPGQLLKDQVDSFVDYARVNMKVTRRAH